MCKPFFNYPIKLTSLLLIHLFINSTNIYERITVGQAQQSAAYPNQGCLSSPGKTILILFYYNLSKNYVTFKGRHRQMVYDLFISNLKWCQCNRCCQLHVYSLLTKMCFNCRTRLTPSAGFPTRQWGRRQWGCPLNHQTFVSPSEQLFLGSVLTFFFFLSWQK